MLKEKEDKEGEAARFLRRGEMPLQQLSAQTQNTTVGIRGCGLDVNLRMISQKQASANFYYAWQRDQTLSKAT